ncbi:MAG TPA: DUF4062 domain-containing protein [Pyrinomonadaceae bacterium]|jgi:WD40 repeat protein
MSKRIFLSSTYKDLKTYRARVRAMLRQIGAIDIAMEDFGEVEQQPKDKDYCLSHIREGSDIFVGIYAHRYGSIPPGDTISILEAEYDTAIEVNLPTLIFILDDGMPWPPAFIGDDTEKLRLNQFKQKLREATVVETFTTEEDLVSKVATSLSRLFIEREINVRGKTEAKAEELERWDDLSTIDNWEVDVSPTFFGRQQEIRLLKTWIVDEACRVVTILGIGGIGKTSLVSELTRQIQDDAEARFDYAIGRTLKNSPRLNDVLAEVVGILAQEKDVRLAGDINETINLLLGLLKTRRCLLVLDNAEAILREGDMQYRPGYEDYGKLFARFGAVQHRGCLLITSREKPREIARQEGAQLPIRSYEMEGLDEKDAIRYLRAKGVSGTDDELRKVVAYCNNIPFMLEFMPERIKQVYQGSIEEFLKNPGPPPSDYTEILDEQFNRLSHLEKQIMYWLMVSREPVSFQKLREELLPTVPIYDLQAAVMSLRGRSLIMPHAAGFTQIPLIMEYMTGLFVRQICVEVTTGSLSLYKSHPLCEALTKDYLRETQIYLILQPVARQLLKTFKTTQKLEQRFKHILDSLKPKDLTLDPDPGYGAGNIINLASHLSIDLSGYNFSHLSIEQAFLRNVNLNNVDFSHAHFSKIAFTETLNFIMSVACSPDGEFVAAGDSIGMVNIWRVSDGAKHFTFRAHPNTAWGMAFSPDSQTLATGGNDHVINLWDVQTCQLKASLPNNKLWVASVAFSPDGRLLASGSGDCTVKLWNVASGQCLKTLQGHTEYVHGIAFSPDGNLLASASTDRTVRLWSVAEQKQLGELLHDEPVFTVAYSPDGRLLATGSADKMVRLWDIAQPSEPRCLHTLAGHHDHVSSVVLSPDGQTLWSASHDQTIKKWDVRDLTVGHCRATLVGHTHDVHSLALTRNGQLLASGSSDMTMRMWETTSGKCVQVFQGYNRSIEAIAWSPDGQTVAGGSGDNLIRLWDVATRQCRRILKEHQERVTTLAFSPSRDVLASGSTDRTVRLWDVRSGECFKVFDVHKERLRTVVFAPDGKLLASSSCDNTIKLWDMEMYNCRATLEGSQNLAGTIAFSRDGKLLAATSEDYTIKLWDVSAERPHQVLPGHESGWATTIDFHPHQPLMATAGHDYSIKLWNIETGKCVDTITGHANRINSIAFSPDGRVLVSGSADRTVKVWDVATHQCLDTLTHPDYWINSVAFSPDGSMFASGGAAQTIYLWDAKTRSPLERMRFPKLYEGMNVAGATGLTPSQISTLQELGAVASAP